MKRTLVITLTVALFGALAVVGFTGAAAAQEDPSNLSDSIIEQTIGDLEAEQNQDLQSGDANVNVNVDQTNNNAQTSGISAGDAFAATSGGTGSSAFSNAEASQSQNVDQTNAADIDATAESGDVTGEQNLEQEPEQDAEVGDVTVVDDDDETLWRIRNDANQIIADGFESRAEALDYIDENNLNPNFHFVEPYSPS
ncbi:hypothetical protein [Halopiger thermotolerans]